jgi:signal transduction histidine kinase
MSLSRTLTRMNMLVSGTALGLACVTFVGYDLVSFRDLRRRQLIAEADAIGSRSESAIAAERPKAVRDQLEALRAQPDVISATVEAANGHILATYLRTPDTPPPLHLNMAPGTDGASFFGWRRATAGARVTSDHATVGFVYIQTTLAPMYERLFKYLWIVGGVLAASLITALAVSRLVQRSISQPLVQLAEVARRVSEHQDYAIRAAEPATVSYEVGSVIRSFNAMLGQVQIRDLSLQRAREELEERVRRRTEELDRTNRELEAFSYSVSHDLRAPLRHVVGFASLLEQRSADSLDDRGRGYVRTITEAARRMGRLIDDLLAFSRMGRASLTPQDVDLGRLIREAKAEISPETVGHEIVWTIQPMPTVYGDPSLLRPAMANLLSNAVKYSSTRAVAHIEIGTTTADDGSVTVYVKDNGVGFDMQYVEKLFGVFQRLHSSEEFSGTGIGLANVRRIVSRHGGRTWAEADVDRGATFFFSLPPRPREL